MKLSCPRCGGRLDDGDVNVDARVALCRPCGVLWPVSAPERQVTGASDDASPSAVRIERTGGTLEVSARLGSLFRLLWAPVVVMALFAALWVAATLYATREHPETVIFGVLGGLVGLVPLAGALALALTRFRLILTPDEAVLKREALIPKTRRYVLDASAHCTWQPTKFPFLAMAAAPDMASAVSRGLSLVIDGTPLPLPLARTDADGRRVTAAINAHLDATFGRSHAPRITPGAQPRVPRCPECGRDLAAGAVDIGSVELVCAECDGRFPLVIEHCPAAGGPSDERKEQRAPKPADTTVVIEYPSPGEMLVYVPPIGFRGSAKGLFVFSCIWLGFMVVFTSIWVFAAGEEGGDRGFFDRYGPLFFCGLFWLVGFGMMAAALRLAFEKVFVLIEPDRITLRTERFRKERTRVFPRTAATDAHLDVAYSQNDVPVHRIAFTADAAKARFGTGLSEEEKRWLLGEIRRFMGGAS